MGVLHHDDGGIDHGPDSNGDAAQGHDVGGDALLRHDYEGPEDAKRQGDDRHEGRTNVQQEDQAYQGNHQGFLDQLVVQVIHRPLDQRRPVVDRHDLNSWRKTGLDLDDLGLHRLDDRQGVLAGAHDHHAPGDLAFAVQLHDTAAQFRPFDDAGDVGQQHRRAALGIDHHVLQLAEIFGVAGRAHHQFGLSLLDHPAADLAAGRLHGADDPRQGNPVGPQPVGIDEHLIFLDEAADRGHFRHAGNGGQLELDEPVLQRSQIGQITLPGSIHQAILINPTDPGGVRADLRARRVGQGTAQGGQGLDDPRACPILVHAVLEDHIDETGAKHGVAAHVLCLRQPEHGGRQGVGHQIFDNLWRLPHKVGTDDHLGIGQVGNGIQGRSQYRQPPGDDQGNRPDDDQQLVADRPVDDRRDVRLGWVVAGFDRPCIGLIGHCRQSQFRVNSTRSGPDR